MTIARTTSAKAAKKANIEKIVKYTKKIEKNLKKINKYMNECDSESDSDEPQSNHQQLLITNYMRPKRRITIVKKPVLVIDVDTLRTINVDQGTVMYGNVNGNEYRNLTFIGLLKELYNIVGIGMVIYNTTLNLSRTKKDEPGFHYFPDLRLSMQSVSNTDIMSEIIHIAKISRFTLKIKIKLKNNKIVLFRM
jgi:hypothetical protein